MLGKQLANSVANSRSNNVTESVKWLNLIGGEQVENMGAQKGKEYPFWPSFILSKIYSVMLCFPDLSSKMLFYGPSYFFNS